MVESEKEGTVIAQPGRDVVHERVRQVRALEHRPDLEHDRVRQASRSRIAGSAVPRHRLRRPPEGRKQIFVLQRLRQRHLEVGIPSEEVVRGRSEKREQLVGRDVIRPEQVEGSAFDLVIRILRFRRAFGERKDLRRNVAIAAGLQCRNGAAAYLWMIGPV
jgi:hypothetical protein